jgi:hypothetical protein
MCDTPDRILDAALEEGRIAKENRDAAGSPSISHWAGMVQEPSDRAQTGTNVGRGSRSVARSGNKNPAKRGSYRAAGQGLEP